MHQSLCYVKNDICALECVCIKLLLQFRFRLLMSASPIQKLIGYDIDDLIFQHTLSESILLTDY